MSGEDRVVQLLEELIAWTRFANQDTLAAALRTVLAEQKHLTAYELTDGSRTQQQVAEVSGISQQTVSALWQRWRRLGLARELPGGKVRHLIRPSDLGIGLAGVRKTDSTGSGRSGKDI